MSFSLPALIISADRVEDFDCGNDSLNIYLKRFALTNTAAGTARTFVTTISEDRKVVGYYSLSAGSVEKALVAERVAKGVPSHPIPVVLLARLAVDRALQGAGIGKGLLRDALQRSLSAAEIIGIRAVLVHAKETEPQIFIDSSASWLHPQINFI
jgi:GNAT superfamily N-acetyltransferase